MSRLDEFPALDRADATFKLLHVFTYIAIVGIARTVIEQRIVDTIETIWAVDA
jgi:hypothetical protein